MQNFWQIMQLPAIATLVMAPLHCLFGLHIVRRGVIFIDVAVAQAAALGMAVALANNHEVGDSTTYWLSLAYAMGAALLIALTRFKLGRVPHEAIIGIIFVLASALGIIVLEATPHGVEELKGILSGSILFVQPTDLTQTEIVYGIILVIAVLVWRPTTAISIDDPAAPSGWRRIVLDFVFYGLLAFVVAISVKIAGVLVVFTWLVMPPVAAFLWVDQMKHSLFIALPLCIVGSLGGLWVSAARDWPTGPAIVVVFGAVVAVLYIVKLFVPERRVVQSEP